MAWAESEFPDAPEDDGDYQEPVKKTGRIGEKYELAKGDHSHYILPIDFYRETSHGKRVDIIQTLIVCEYRQFILCALPMTS